MPIKWTTTEVDGFKVTHKVGANPKQLVAAHQSQALAIVGDHPIVHQKQLGKQLLAFRKMRIHGGEYAEIYHSPVALFKDLQRINESPLREFEEPVATITHSSDPHSVTVVSKWKKGSKSLASYLLAENINVDKKIKMCKTAMTSLARLSSKEYVHGHIKAENFVVLPKGKAHLIDYTLIRPPQGHSELGNEAYAAAVNLASVISLFAPNAPSTYAITIKLLAHYKRMINVPKRKFVKKVN